jgi:small subunit ribosomal protein S19e
MVKLFDVNQQKLVEQLASDLKEAGKIKMPEWAKFVKTGVYKERMPVSRDWWFFRAGSVMRKIYLQGPIGVAKLRTGFGGKKNRGVKPERFLKASGKIIRVILQQLEASGLIKKVDKSVHKGRIATPEGKSFVDKAAGKIYEKKELVQQTAEAKE